MAIVLPGLQCVKTKFGIAMHSMDDHKKKPVTFSFRFWSFVGIFLLWQWGSSVKAEKYFT